MYFDPTNIHRLLIIGIALFYLINGSISDLKTREVLDYANFSLIALGVALNFIYASIFGEWKILLETMAGLAVFVGIAYLMFYAGQWGGGDSKMLMGLGALFGLQFDLTKMPFIADFIIMTFLVGAVYGILWSFTLSIIHWKKVSVKLVKKLEKSKFKKYFLFFAGALAIGGVISYFTSNSPMWVLFVTMSFMTMFSFYLWVFVKSIEHVIMYKNVLPSKLTEGDWIVDDVIVEGRIICGPKDLGISLEQIKELKRLKKDNVIDKILIKEGIPFVPSFLFAFIICIFFSQVYLFFL